MSASPTPPVLTEAEQIEQLKKQLHWAHLEIQVLKERLRLQRIAKYGPGSENGGASSHGCVHIPTPVMQWAFDWTPLGTPVIISY